MLGLSNLRWSFTICHAVSGWKQHRQKRKCLFHEWNPNPVLDAQHVFNEHRVCHFFTYMSPSVGNWTMQAYTRLHRSCACHRTMCSVLIPSVFICLPHQRAPWPPLLASQSSHLSNTFSSYLPASLFPQFCFVRAFVLIFFLSSTKVVFLFWVMAISFPFTFFFFVFSSTFSFWIFLHSVSTFVPFFCFFSRFRFVFRFLPIVLPFFLGLYFLHACVLGPTINCKHSAAQRSTTQSALHKAATQVAWERDNTSRLAELARAK